MNLTEWIMMKSNLIIDDFTQEFCEVVKDMYGDHNYKAAVDIVNKELDNNIYFGDNGESNMKAELKEIMHACGDRDEFTKLCNDVQDELDEAVYDLNQENRILSA